MKSARDEIRDTIEARCLFLEEEVPKAVDRDDTERLKDLARVAQNISNLQHHPRKQDLTDADRYWLQGFIMMRLVEMSERIGGGLHFAKFNPSLN
ncbi:MAG: hypothetical protein JST46_13180 [Bacteroidetes bacterium]|nr:hypothetical protein [Bacteroidota bacterium]